MNLYTTHYGGYDFECEATSRDAAKKEALAHFKGKALFARINLSLADMQPVLIHEDRPLNPVVRSPLFE